MPFYELIFETGNYSVAEYADDDEALSAVGAHHERAVNGERSNAADPDNSPPAERIARVLRYDEHPANHGESQAIDLAAVTSVAKEIAQGDLVSVPELAAALRSTVDATLLNTSPHDSNYKMQETHELSGWSE